LVISYILNINTLKAHTATSFYNKKYKYTLSNDVLVFDSSISAVEYAAKINKEYHQDYKQQYTLFISNKKSIQYVYNGPK